MKKSTSTPATEDTFLWNTGGLWNLLCLPIQPLTPAPSAFRLTPEKKNQPVEVPWLLSQWEMPQKMYVEDCHYLVSRLQLLGLNSSATTLSLSSYQVLRLDTAEEIRSCLFCSGGDHFIFLLLLFPALTRWALLGFGSPQQCQRCSGLYTQQLMRARTRFLRHQ